MDYVKHPLSDVKTLNIGNSTTIWQYVVILEKAIIGGECNICSHCFIENDVTIGDRTTIKNGVCLWDGCHLESDVFVGPNVTFSNDKYPRSKNYVTDFPRTVVKQGATIGANATILPGITIGENAIIGAGAVVVSDVPQNAVIIGNPGRVVRFLNDRKPTDFKKGLGNDK